MLLPHETVPDVNDVLVQVMLCGDETGKVPEIGKIPKQYRGGRTKGQVLRDALRIQTFADRYPEETHDLRMKIRNIRRGVPSKVTVPEQQLVGASA